jgi:hypothetical protein
MLEILYSSTEVNVNLRDCEGLGQMVWYFWMFSWSLPTLGIQDDKNPCIIFINQTLVWFMIDLSGICMIVLLCMMKLICPFNYWPQLLYDLRFLNVVSSCMIQLLYELVWSTLLKLLTMTQLLFRSGPQLLFRSGPQLQFRSGPQLLFRSGPQLLFRSGPQLLFRSGLIRLHMGHLTLTL